MLAMQIIKATAVAATMLLIVAAVNIAVKIIRINK
jgi:hypothetical protein